ncbi:MAG: SBBP repeat-containing protein, partial [Flavobacteriales bacterium]
MRSGNYTNAPRYGALLAFILAVTTGLNAQRVSNTHGDHDAAVDNLLHKFDEQITFTENQGQFSAGVLFKADFPLGQALATRDGMLMKAYDAESVRQRQEAGIRQERDLQEGKPFRPLTWRERGHGWMLHFLNASAEMRIESRDAHDEASNYFTGGKQALGLRSYQEVWYTNVYRGTDVRYYPAADGSLEYDIICKAGSDPREIAIEFKGIERLRTNEKGELVMSTSLGDMTYPAPVVYQNIGGREVAVSAKYRVSSGNVLGFELGAYNRTQPLVIDPIAMRWATWVNTNSSDDNHGHAIWVDPSDGAIYVVARVVGTTDNITVGAFDTSANGNLEIIVGKYLEPATVGGSGTRVWQTYIGGSGDDNPYAMEQGPDGNLYITGQTSSTNFPLLGGTGFSGASLDQQAQSDIDVFVLKINTAGTGIKAAVVGGNGADDNFDVRLAANGDVFVCGSTASTNLLTLNAGSGASNTNNGGADALVFRINQDLSSLVWMRNYGGSGADRASIMLHNAATNDLFVGGNTSSTNFPTASPRQATRGGTSAGFLQRLTGAGTTTWSSYFSSAASQSANLLCMEFNTTKTELYFGGVTTGLNAANISANGVHDSSPNGSNDFYVARIGIDQTFLAGTYIGGSNNEVNMMGLNADLNNDVYVFGYTNSANFPVSSTPNVPLQSTNQGNNDKVFFKLQSDLSALEFSTYYGGAADDYDPVGERGIKFSNCRIYTIVTAQSNNIPLTQGALNTTKNSPTSRYEPGLVVWANPPDLLGNTIAYQGTAICAGTTPGDILGSMPSYVLPTVLRNNVASAYPAFPPAATYQWQISTDSLNWSNIAGATGQNIAGAAIGPVTQTTYIRRIIGGDACILAGAADQVVTVRLMTASGTMAQPSCHGGANGTITATADGEAPFTYAWSNGQSAATAINLMAGSYSVTVTDANGCSAVANFILGEPTAVGGSAQVTTATCSNDNGSASATGSGGTSGYSYEWNTGALGATLTGVPAGNYSVTITDAHQCPFVLPVVIGGTAVPNANAGPDAQITCLNNGQVVLDGSSSTQGASFGWSGPGIVSGGSSDNVTVNAAGTYVLTVTDQQSGCSNTDAASVTLNNTPPGAQATGGTLTCTITSVQLIGGGNGSFSWTGPNGFTSGDQNPTVSAAGTYVLTVTGANGCTSVAQADVILNDTAP